jgi:hypothetical protein
VEPYIIADPFNAPGVMFGPQEEMYFVTFM